MLVLFVVTVLMLHYVIGRGDSGSLMLLSLLRSVLVLLVLVSRISLSNSRGSEPVAGGMVVIKDG